MSWLIPNLPAWASTSKPTTTSDSSSPSQVSTTATSDEDDLDLPPSFPLPDSAQRSRPAAAAPAPSFDISPPSPTPSTSSSRTASPPRRAAPASALQRPTTTTKLPPLPVGGDNPPPPAKAKKSKKVALAPGCSPLDWARLKGSGEEDMKGGWGYRFPMRVTMEELKKHNTIDDAWSAFNGRVYNLVPYIRFHPGGEKELMRCAGRDGTKLFMATHAWVSVEQMMDECLIGMLVPG